MKFRESLLKTIFGQTIGKNYKGAGECSDVIWQPIEKEGDKLANYVRCRVIENGGRERIWAKGSLVYVSKNHISLQRV